LKVAVYAIGTGINHGAGFIGYLIMEWPMVFDKYYEKKLGGKDTSMELPKDKPDQSPSNFNGDLENRL
jgi:hypothetical protein